MLKLPGNLTAQQFLARHWQKESLFMPQATGALRPAVTRNELAWLATLDDVESRIVFTDRDEDRIRYRVESGPFATGYLRSLPRRDWSLLVHDVEKHLPAMRALLRLVPFIPDWRIDDLMVSFAAPGGGVGPHRDNYDVFLCQGIGIREWRYSTADIIEDATASRDLALLQEFNGDECCLSREGDVLYLPPGVAHWGTAQRACITYSIGMRAPPGYVDADLQLDEVLPGYISAAALRRAADQATTFGCAVTELKEWLQPIGPDEQDIENMLAASSAGRALRLHGMTRIAYDDAHLYVNGAARQLEAGKCEPIALLCARRRLSGAQASGLYAHCLRWLLAQGAFEIPEHS